MKPVKNLISWNTLVDFGVMGASGLSERKIKKIKFKSVGPSAVLRKVCGGKLNERVVCFSNKLLPE